MSAPEEVARRGPLERYAMLRLEESSPGVALVVKTPSRTTLLHRLDESRIPG